MQYSVQSNHVHLLVEVDGAHALGRGMKSIGARLARAVNRVFLRKGPVLEDRYHMRLLRTPREVRHALRYVLLNARKHFGRATGSPVDPASSGRWFGGWATKDRSTARRSEVCNDRRARSAIRGLLGTIPSYMEAHRFREIYLNPENTVLENFLGDPTWRERWYEAEAGQGPRDFGVFVVDRFGNAMKDLGYLYGGLDETEPVRDKHLLLYHLAFFSRNKLGMKFWREARRYSRDQLRLPLGDD